MVSEESPGQARYFRFILGHINRSFSFENGKYGACPAFPPRHPHCSSWPATTQAPMDRDFPGFASNMRKPLNPRS